MYTIAEIFKAAFIIITDKALHPKHVGRKIAVLVVKEEARGKVFLETRDNILVVGMVKTKEAAIG